MTVNIGPTNWWWVASPNAPYLCHVKGTVRTFGRGGVLRDGSMIICVGSNSALIVAPCCTQVGSQWAGGQYNSALCGNRCCICEWPGLESRLTSCGFTPSDWCVPTQGDLFLSYCCRAFWDDTESTYWSSTEENSTTACRVYFETGTQFAALKTFTYCVRAFRRVTY